MKTILKLAALLAVTAGAVNLRQTAKTLETLEHGVIRLHILADSDSLEDQTEKLLVRDALLGASAGWFDRCADAEDCLAVLEQRLPEIERTAAEALRGNGSSDTVSASLGVTAFPARTYGSVTLPAGRYQSLTVQIGAGEGQNWWCVMYPALCLPAALPADRQHTLLSGALPEDAVGMMQEPERYEIRLKCVDVCRSVAAWVTDRLAGISAGQDRKSE